MFFENLGRNKRLGSRKFRRRDLVDKSSRQVSDRYDCRVLDVSLRQVGECRVLIELRGDSELYGQANKRRRWMPWRSEAMKDVAACEKHGGAGNEH